MAVSFMAGTGTIFRVFVSSTFSDLKAERNALQKFVFPRLRELCQRHGCRFRAIDRRWGIHDEAALDQQTIRICLEEIARCQRVTPRPNVIVLLGERYGWRPLPFPIPRDEFAEIERRIGCEEDRGLLKKWYRCDENAMPLVYDLRRVKATSKTRSDGPGSSGSYARSYLLPPRVRQPAAVNDEE